MDGLWFVAGMVAGISLTLIVVLQMVRVWDEIVDKDGEG